jgi:hypothetical protein
MLNQLTLAILICAPLAAFGANRVGNGGNVAICETDGQIQKILLLDFFEKDGFDFKFETAKGDHEAILKSRLQVLQKLAPKLAAQYQRRSETIKAEWQIKDGIKIKDVEDSLHAVEPEGKDCGVKQIAVRTQDKVDGKHFIVNKKYWGKLDETNRAGLKAHEIVYEHLSKLGETDSRKARRLVSLMFSDRFDKMSGSDFWLFVKDLKLPLYP